METAIDFLNREQASIPEDWFGRRSRLYDILNIALRMVAQDNTDISALNQIGIYHRFHPAAGDPFAASDSLDEVPDHWITRGESPGIWCTFFSPSYTYSSRVGDPIIAQILLRPGFRLYDPASESDQEEWQTWASKPANTQKFNKWDVMQNSGGKSMSDRVKVLLGAPTHYAFYAEMDIGAIVGYSDYMALVIIDEGVIENVSAVRERRHPETTVGLKYGISWGTTKDPEAPEQSQLIAQWGNYVQSVLQRDGLSSMVRKGNKLWLEDSFEQEKFPSTLSEVGFRIRALQYGRRLYFKQVTAPPPMIGSPKKRRFIEHPRRPCTRYFLRSQRQPERL